MGEIEPSMFGMLLPTGLDGCIGTKRYVMERKISPRRAAELSKLQIKSCVMMHRLRSKFGRLRAVQAVQKIVYRDGTRRNQQVQGMESKAEETVKSVSANS